MNILPLASFKGISCQSPNLANKPDLKNAEDAYERKTTLSDGGASKMYFMGGLSLSENEDEIQASNLTKESQELLKVIKDKIEYLPDEEKQVVEDNLKRVEFNDYNVRVIDDLVSDEHLIVTDGYRNILADVLNSVTTQEDADAKCAIIDAFRSHSDWIKFEDGHVRSAFNHILENTTTQENVDAKCFIMKEASKNPIWVDDSNDYPWLTKMVRRTGTMEEAEGRIMFANYLTKHDPEVFSNVGWDGDTVIDSVHSKAGAQVAIAAHQCPNLLHFAGCIVDLIDNSVTQPQADVARLIIKNSELLEIKQIYENANNAVKAVQTQEDADRVCNTITDFLGIFGK